MSMYDPIDQSLIKQAVLVDFFNFHLKNDDVWAVLNEKSILFASDVFLLTGIEHFLYENFNPSFTELLNSDFVDFSSKSAVISFPSLTQFRKLKKPPIYFIEISKFNNHFFYLKAISLFSKNLSLYDINIINKAKKSKKFR